MSRKVLFFSIIALSMFFLSPTITMGKSVQAEGFAAQPRGLCVLKLGGFTQDFQRPTAFFETREWEDLTQDECLAQLETSELERRCQTWWQAEDHTRKPGIAAVVALQWDENERSKEATFSCVELLQDGDSLASR